MAVRCPHDGDVRSDAVQPGKLVHPFTLDCCLALQFQAQFDEERDGSREILDHDADVIHPAVRHATQRRGAGILAVDNIAAEEDGGLSFVSGEPFSETANPAFKASVMGFMDSVDTMILGANTYA